MEKLTPGTRNPQARDPDPPMKSSTLQSVLMPFLSAALLILLVRPAFSAPPRPAIFEELNTSLDPMMPLEEGWQAPPRIARTRVWWWWLNGNTDKPTITRDLEAMKAVGLGGANIIDAGGDDQRGNRRLPAGPTFGTPEWIELFRHAVAEADRLGLELGFNIQSGWNLGGPKVTPEHASKKLTFSSIRAEGGKSLDLVLPLPPLTGEYYRDTRVIAVPISAGRGGVVVSASSVQSGSEASLAADGDPATFWVSAGRAAGQGPTPE